MGELTAIILGLIFWVFLFLPFFGSSGSKNPSRPAKKKLSTQNNPPQMYASRTFNNFDYYETSDKSEFFVYFIENPALKSLKVGVGNMGRIEQLLQSSIEKNENSTNIGWKVLRIARFADSTTNFDSGKLAGNEAERRAHYYWRYVLCQPQHLKASDLGFSRIWKDDSLRWVQTPGYTETVEIGTICEQSTWNYVIKSPGFLGELEEYAGRRLEVLHPRDIELNVPRYYEQFNLVQINHKNRVKFEPVTNITTGSNSTYRNESEIADELKKTKNPNVKESSKSYTGAKIGIYPCLTNSCKNPSSSMFTSAKCEQCASKNA